MAVNTAFCSIGWKIGRKKDELSRLPLAEGEEGRCILAGLPAIVRWDGSSQATVFLVRDGEKEGEVIRGQERTFTLAGTSLVLETPPGPGKHPRILRVEARLFPPRTNGKKKTASSSACPSRVVPPSRLAATVSRR